MARQLTEEQNAEIVRRYEAGSGIRPICKSLHLGERRVRSLLVREGVAIRPSPHTQAAAALDEISGSRWREIYWGPASGYPSLEELGRQFCVDTETIRRRLQRHGIAARSRSEQTRIDMKAGKRPEFPRRVPDGRKNEFLLALNGQRSGRRRARAAVAQGAAARRQRISVPCAWCGAQLERVPSRMKRQSRHGCSVAHAARSREWATGVPRPLILDKLRDLLREEPYKALPFTWETCEKAGAAIGAGEAEISAVLLELR